MKKLLTILSVILLASAAAGAQDDSTYFAEIALADSVFADSGPKLINDYSMIGVNYGVTFSNTYFSPSKHNRLFVSMPNYVSVMYTKHCKMFDTMPYFALVLGAAMGTEGFAFEADKQTGVTADAYGATWCSIKVFEVPVMAQIHIDSEPFKVMANLGIYGGWRQSITRSGPNLDTQWSNTFRDYENRFDYGFQGGAGIALMFDPIEIHFNCLLRWSWSSLYQPEYASRYYYNYAYPIDIIASVGIHFQLTKRNGRTKSQIRKAAYEKVYGTTQDNSGKGR